MFTIHKKRQPSALIQYKKENDASYGYISRQIKNELRKSLLEEQGYICAYCMSRIHDDRFTTKIEHIKPQGNYPNEGLNYLNMLAVCSGGEGSPLNQQHCDTFKGDKELCFSPTDRSFMLKQKIRYDLNGVIRSDNEDLNTDLNQVLNLNVWKLKESRYAVISGVRKGLSKIARHANRNDIDKLIDKWITLDASGKKKPYFAAAVYVLGKRKRRCIS